MRYLMFVVVQLVLFSTLAYAAPTVFFKDGTTAVGNSVWMEDNKVYLSRSNEMFEFDPADVKLDETLSFNRLGKYQVVTPLDQPGSIPVASGEKRHRMYRPHRAHRRAVATAQKAPKKPAATAAAGAPAAKPVSAGAAAKAMPATGPHGSPSVQKELDAVYGKLYAAMRSGDYNEQKKYVAGEQRKALEAGEKSPAVVKAARKRMMATMDKNYTVTGCSVAPDGKSATLTTSRMVTGHAVSGVVSFVKVGNEWKVSLVKE